MPPLSHDLRSVAPPWYAPPVHHRIDYIELTVDDFAAAKAFYGAAFGWSFTDYGPPGDPQYVGIAGMKEGAPEQGGFARGVVRPGEGAPLVVLYSDDLEATLASVDAAGGTITKPIFAFPGGRRFEFRDPAGNTLAVWTHVKAG